MITTIRALTLHAHEVRRLLAAGSALLVRPESKQPPWVYDVVWQSEDAATLGRWYFGARAGGYLVDEWPPGGLYPPLGAPGDTRWCREKWRVQGYADGAKEAWIEYGDYAVSDSFNRKMMKLGVGDSWRSPVTMPRWTSRLSVVVQAVAVKRVGELTHEQAIESGIVWSPGQRSDPKIDFIIMWDERYEKQYHYRFNPWVWLVSVNKAA